MRVAKLPQALADLVETAEYIAEDDIDAADRFFDAFEAALETIRQTPKIGSVRRVEGDPEVRMWPIRGFEKSLIFYTESPDEIVVLRVIHSSRDYTRFIGG
jgi:toxin ParE1/3/4